MRNSRPFLFVGDQPVNLALDDRILIENGSNFRKYFISYELDSKVWVILPRYYLRDKSVYAGVKIKFRHGFDGCKDIVSLRSFGAGIYQLSNLWTGLPLSIFVKKKSLLV
jgi:hypothetical protein